MNFSRNMVFWVIIAFLLFALFNLFQGPQQQGVQSNLAYSEFLTAVDSGEVRDVTLQSTKGGGVTITGHLGDGRTFSSFAPDDPTMVARLTDNNVRIQASPSDDGQFSLMGMLVGWLPFLVLIGVWV
ncbi:MAG: ATP-dependent metallopeptidase FtsH/Yme1/Tma family protein, partial [Sphingomonadales bacterium]|nr:ATP-dependent metallopeptidase FtsH/Yme1/Tma family protein [Sphingomonadales bacterium]